MLQFLDSVTDSSVIKQATSKNHGCGSAITNHGCGSAGVGSLRSRNT
ncbi:hypothetical protein M8C21_024821 [Ambrosia artemisiifolia]|uniref:Uncharacterized protein n=1 Tax=Ambrosia artemisiifolia TaxID=4212 RepID=A0AAD5D733_AMBAR|nr:hypothetical protein M8C21_024821 [Ambrosia artemisiifolia]